MTKYGLYTLLGLVALAGSFAAGRYTVPTRVETRTEYLDKVREVRTTVIQRIVDTKVHRVIEVRPDGSSKTVEHIDTHEDTRTDENENSYKESKESSAKIVSSTRASWQIYVVGGATVPFPWHQNAPGLTFGAMLNRRLFGPLWANTYVLSNGSVGGGLGLEF